MHVCMEGAVQTIILVGVYGGEGAHHTINTLEAHLTIDM